MLLKTTDVKDTKKLLRTEYAQALIFPLPRAAQVRLTVHVD